MDNSAVLTWEYPAVPGLQRFDLFCDQTQESPNGFTSPAATAPPEARSYTFADLAPGTYYFAVRAVVAGVNSGFSNQVSKAIEIPVPVLSVA
jgi:hypothetical protein